MIKLVTLSHNFQRFFLTETESKTVTRGQIDSLIALINDLGNIFFKLPKLFYPFPPFDAGHTGESKTEEQMKMILTRDKGKRRRYGSILRYTILAFIDAMIYCSNELLRLENEEKSPKEEKSSIVGQEDEEGNISFEFSALEIIRKMYRKILELATICN